MIKVVTNDSGLPPASSSDIKHYKYNFTRPSNGATLVVNHNLNTMNILNIQVRRNDGAGGNHVVPDYAYFGGEYGLSINVDNANTISIYWAYYPYGTNFTLEITYY